MEKVCIIIFLGSNSAGKTTIVSIGLNPVRRDSRAVCSISGRSKGLCLFPSDNIPYNYQLGVKDDEVNEIGRS